MKHKFKPARPGTEDIQFLFADIGMMAAIVGGGLLHGFSGLSLLVGITTYGIAMVFAAPLAGLIGNIDWEPSAKFCAGSAHMGWAAAVVAAGRLHGLPWWAILGGFTVFAALKEFWADLTWLEHDKLTGSVYDFVTYMAGMALGAAACFSFWWAAGGAITVLIALACLDFMGDLPESYPRSQERG